MRENSDRRRTNLFANVGFALTDVWMIGMVFTYVQGEFGKPPSTIDDRADPFAAPPKYKRVDEYRNYSWQLSLNYDVPGPLDVRAWGYVNHQDEEENRYDDNTYSSMNDLTVKGTYHQETTTSIKGVSFQPKIDLGLAGTITLAAAARGESWELRGKMRDVRVREGGGGSKRYAFRRLDAERANAFYSLAAEYTVPPLNPRLGLVLGYGLHWFRKKQGKDDEDFNFTAGAFYDLVPGTRFRGSAARKIRFPSLRQLYGEEEGNPGLTTEVSYHYELGLEQHLPLNSKVSLVGFWTDVDDYIEKIPPNNVFMNNDQYRL